MEDLKVVAGYLPLKDVGNVLFGKSLYDHEKIGYSIGEAWKDVGFTIQGASPENIMWTEELFEIFMKSNIKTIKSFTGKEPIYCTDIVTLFYMDRIDDLFNNYVGKPCDETYFTFANEVLACTEELVINRIKPESPLVVTFVHLPNSKTLGEKIKANPVEAIPSNVIHSHSVVMRGGLIDALPLK